MNAIYVEAKTPGGMMGGIPMVAISVSWGGTTEQPAVIHSFNDAIFPVDEMRLSAQAMDELAKAWLRKRMYLVLSGAE